MGFGTLATASAAGEQSPIEELSGRAADRAVATARASDDFGAIKAAVAADGYQIREESAVGYQVTPIGATEQQSFRAVVFEYATSGGGQSVEIGVPVDSNSTQPAKATIVERAGDEFPLKFEEFSAGTGVGTGDAALSDQEGVSVQTETIFAGGSTVTKRTTDLSEFYAGMSTDGGPDGVTASIPDDKCETGSTMPCWGCKDLVAAVNVVTCGTAVWLICGAISIPTGGMGGLACGIAVGLVCWAISHYGTNNPTEVCQLVCACP